MSPPVYADLGKQSKDVFGKGYHFGLLKFECKAKTASGVEFTTNATNNTEKGSISGSLETKHKCKDYGVTFTEKWSTDNTLNTQLNVEDQIVKGLKLTLDTNFAPQTGTKNGQLKFQYKHDTVTAESSVTLDPAGPNVNGSIVVAYQGWLAGYQMGYDTSKSKLTKSNFAVGYNGGDYILHTNVNDGSEFGGSLYHKLNKDLETGVSLGWRADSNKVSFGIGCKHILDADTSVRAKLDNDAHLGLACQHKLRQGMTLTLSSLFDTKNFNAGGHKIGLAFECEA